MSENFFTGDSHLFHSNIILYSSRPYAQEGVHYYIVDGKKQWKNEAVKRECGEAMTNDIIKKHNSVVQPQDTVWHLGDYCFGQYTVIAQCLRRMNGNFKFISGNHDKDLKIFANHIKEYNDLWKRTEFLGDFAEVTINGQLITLCHYALRTWNKSHHNAWSLYGHSHGSLPDLPDSMSFDVGVDCHNYTPLRFDQVQAIMAKKSFKPVDHHGSTV